MKEILQYKNGLNNLELGKMNSREQDIFFYILYILSKNKNHPVEIPFLELKRMIGITDLSKTKFVDIVKKMVKKFQSTVQEYQLSEDEILIFNVLDDTRINTKKEIITTSLKAAFKDLLEIEEKSKCYMSIDLKEMCSLKSSYLKILYRYLKQWESVGTKTIKIEEFKKMLDVPDSYRFYDIDRRILVPALEEFKNIFIGFNYEKLKLDTKGQRVESITFTWQRVERKKKSSKEIIQPQQQPASGAKKKFSKELALEQTARAEAEVQELKLKENNIIEIIESLKDKKEIVNDKPFISESEFENMYQEWLKLQGVQDNKLTKRGYRLQIQGQYQILENKKAL